MNIFISSSSLFGRKNFLSITFCVNIIVIGFLYIAGLNLIRFCTKQKIFWFELDSSFLDGVFKSKLIRSSMQSPSLDGVQQHLADVFLPSRRRLEAKSLSRFKIVFLCQKNLFLCCLRFNFN